jgi:hypothetical protein
MPVSTVALVILISFFALYGLRNLFRYIRRLRAADPRVWDGVINAYEAQDHRRKPPENPVVFTGSSSIFYWKSLDRDMEPLPVLGRGFGGSQIHQVTSFADRIIFPYSPRAVVLYAGENEIAGALLSPRRSAPQVATDFQDFCTRIHSHIPDLPIYYISIKPPLKRTNFASEMISANRLISQLCAEADNLNFIDISDAMLDSAGRVRAELFKRDGIHLNSRGYAAWTDIIRPVLLHDFGY